MDARLAIFVSERIHGGFAKCSVYPGKVWGTHYKTYKGGRPANFTEQVCDKCGELFIATFHTTMYDTPSGYLEPGCLYWMDYPENIYWDNHKGPHLMAITPNGAHWCIDGRASNCTLPNDKLHRCWVRHGTVPNIHVDKKGLTCKAGAGSIITRKGEPDEYHGFLHNGKFTENISGGRRIHKPRRR
jgi:hypothetical protein